MIDFTRNITAKGGGDVIMAEVIEAIFEDGVFKPLQKVRIKEVKPGA